MHQTVYSRNLTHQKNLAPKDKVMFDLLYAYKNISTGSQLFKKNSFNVIFYRVIIFNGIGYFY